MDCQPGQLSLRKMSKSWVADGFCGVDLGFRDHQRGKTLYKTLGGQERKGLEDG